MIVLSECLLPRLVRCSHPHCKTSLTDESAVFCDHSLAFCSMCDWRDGCAECDLEDAA